MLNICNSSGLVLREDYGTTLEDLYVLISDSFSGKGV